jgi:hypothetical protein
MATMEQILTALTDENLARLAEIRKEERGKQKQKRASTLPQDGRSEVAVDDPTPKPATTESEAAA